MITPPPWCLTTTTMYERTTTREDPRTHRRAAAPEAPPRPLEPWTVAIGAFAFGARHALVITWPGSLMKETLMSQGRTRPRGSYS